MVEFGLKLQDNKVTKWSSHYMNYERLKKLLKTSKASLKNRDELRERYAMKLKAMRQLRSPGDGFAGSVNVADEVATKAPTLAASPSRMSKSVGIGLNALEGSGGDGVLLSSFVLVKGFFFLRMYL